MGTFQFKVMCRNCYIDEKERHIFVHQKVSKKSFQELRKYKLNILFIPLKHAERIGLKLNLGGFPERADNIAFWHS